MAISLKNDKSAVKPKASDTGPVRIALKTSTDRGRVMQEKHSHSGFIIAIVLISCVAVTAPIGTFFWAKGIGWEEGKELAKGEYYDYGYGIGYEEGKNASYSLGYDVGQSQGYDKGFEDARNCALRIASGSLASTIYTCYNHALGH